MESTTNKFVEAVEIYNNMTFSDKCKAIKCMKNLSAGLVSDISPIRWDGYVAKKESYAYVQDEGDCYVYLWRHINGDPFYVGSGRKDRWTQKNRNDRFLREIDKGDAVVYKVVTGINRPLAYLYEKYISCSLSLGEFDLCNSDNIINDKSKERDFKDWMYSEKSELESERCKKIEEAVSNIMMDDNFSYSCHLETAKFLKVFGEHYFSETFNKTA